MKNPLPVYAHRGASGYVFENSMAAFEYAKKIGATGIEIDVQTTMDGKLFIIHDLNLRRLTGANIFIDKTLAENIQKLSIGKPFVRKIFRTAIPSFMQVVDWANANDMPLNIELKESLFHHTEPFKQVLPNLILPKGSHISSFYSELLELSKSIRPDIETALIITQKFNLEKLDEFPYVDSIHAHKKYYNGRILQAASLHQKGVRFYAITGNEPFLIDPDPIVKGWITDYPDKVIQLQNDY